jgi:hypothetical protein
MVIRFDIKSSNIAWKTRLFEWRIKSTVKNLSTNKTWLTEILQDTQKECLDFSRSQFSDKQLYFISR